jgi:hypothetical protein
MGLGKRLSDAIASGKEAVRAAQAEQAVRQRVDRTALLVLGHPPDAVLGFVLALQRNGAKDIILITDQSRVDLYQIAGIITEHLPADRVTGMSAQRRLSHVMGKWSVRRCHAVGAAAAHLAERCKVEQPAIVVKRLA